MYLFSTILAWKYTPSSYERNDKEMHLASVHMYRRLNMFSFNGQTHFPGNNWEVLLSRFKISLNSAMSPSSTLFKSFLLAFSFSNIKWTNCQSLEELLLSTSSLSLPQVIQGLLHILYILSLVCVTHTCMNMCKHMHMCFCVSWFKSGEHFSNRQMFSHWDTFQLSPYHNNNHIWKKLN